MSFSLLCAGGMKRGAGIAAVVTVAALTLSACGSDDAEGSDQVSENSGTSDDEEFPMSGNGGSGDGGKDDHGKDAAAEAGKDTGKLKRLYSGTLDDLDVDDFRDPDATVDLTGDYEYAVSDLNADKNPELLVKAVGKEFSAVRVYGASDDNTTTVASSKIFHDGAASAGGSRMSVQTTSDSSGLLATSSQAGNGQTETVLWTFDGSEMTESGQSWNYRIDQIPADLTAVEQNIDWTPVSDLSALEGMDSSAAEDVAPGSGPKPDPVGGAGGTGGAASSGGTLPQSATAPASQIGGTCGTVDGATVTAVGPTSCGFAMAVGQQAMQPVYGPGVAPDPTVTGPAGTATVTATSPTNGQTYTMTCNIGSSGGTAVCSGGNNAQVRVSKEPTGLLSLVN